MSSLSQQKEDALTQEDKCNYFNHDKLPELRFEHKIEKSIIDSLNTFDGFKGKTFGVVFTPNAYKEFQEKISESEQRDLSENQCKESDFYILQSLSQDERKLEEIRLISKKYNFTFFCSIKGPGECPQSLLCFCVLRIDWKKINENRAIKFLGNFKFHHEFKTPKNCDNANILRNYLQEEYNKSSKPKEQQKIINQPKEYITYCATLSLDKNNKTQYHFTKKDKTNKEEILQDSEREKIQEKLGFPLFPKNIISHKNEKLKDKDLEIKIEDLGKSKILSIFLESCDIKKETIQNAYQRGGDYIEKAQEEINEKLEKTINKKFNQFFSSNNTYSFRIRLGDSKITISLRKNNEVITPNKQSEGFKIFFNFFFNFIHSIELTRGDIILIDEAETHLDIEAQREFIAFLKQFGLEHGILFIITTHSPYMITLDNLSSLRIVTPYEHDKKYVGFLNDFSSLPYGEANSLQHIKKALGDFISINEKIIFVEGITDYNYLYAFYAMHDSKECKQKLVFLPIGGLGKYNKNDNKEQKQKAQKIIEFAESLKEHQAFLLVDSDEVGRQFKKYIESNEELKQKLHVISLDEIKSHDKNFNLTDSNNPTIESLFAKEDNEKFNISLSKDLKHANVSSSSFKDISDLKDKVSLTTKTNFKILFDYLQYRLNENKQTKNK